MNTRAFFAKSVLITGASGQDARYLRARLEELGASVVGIARSEGSWLTGNVADQTFVEGVIAECRPDFVFHLAAESTTRLEAARANLDAIATGTLNLLTAVSKWVPSCRFFLAGSGLQFVNTGAPISATSERWSRTAYAAARNYAVDLCRLYRSKGLATYVGYLFHHESPHRPLRHVSQQIVQSAIDCFEGKVSGVSLGDLKVEKEWTFAGDVVEGMLLLVSQDQLSEVSIGSGDPRTIYEFCEACFSHLGLDASDWVREDPSFTAEYPRLVSESSAIRSLGWVPRVTLDQVAAMMIEHAKSER